MRLTNVIQNINLALNYPSLDFNDISLYFDMAISELNTTLHTSIPSVSSMVEKFRQELSNMEQNTIVLTIDPQQNNFEIPINPLAPSNGNPICYYSSTSGCFFAWDPVKKEYISYPSLIGIYIRQGNPEKYVSVIYGNSENYAYWVKKNDIEADCDLGEYLPDDWIMLWLIPYVCFKYTVRDGGTAQTFAEELQQGFQQLQDTYDIPEKVVLATYADKYAYKELVKRYLPNINVIVRTRAIYESMKHDRAINATYGNMFDRGGFLDD